MSSYTTIHLNSKDSQTHPIIDYLNEYVKPLYVHQLETAKLMNLNFSMKCGLSVSLLLPSFQEYFLKEQRTTQVIVETELQVEKIKNYIADHFTSTGDKLQIQPRFKNDGHTLIGYRFTLIGYKSDKKFNNNFF